ncbi:MAG: Nif3-like dinuclear metal center hexameric protein [Pseudomonadota bacterium]
MAVALRELTAYLDNFLETSKFRDYAPNGLQVEGRPEVRLIASGVTASQRLLEAAVDCGADAIVVHHGYFWKGEDPAVVGMKRRRLATLLAHDISLLAYHLPLDAHPVVGNNARLGALLGVGDVAPLMADSDGVGNVGLLTAPSTAGDLRERLATLTQREPLLVGEEAAPVHRVAWCTGAAQGYIDAAVAAGADLFITGEASEQTVHTAREEGIQFIAAGHHATERYGVQALGAHLAEQFGLEHRYIEIDNPV